MAAPETGACGSPWVTWDQVVAFGCDVAFPGDDAAQDVLENLVLGAVSDMLWERTCEQFGICTVTARPVPCCVHHRTVCHCGQYLFVMLGNEPIVSIEHVIIDGAELDPSKYRVDDFQRLVRLDGATWPLCQDLSVADDADGAWTVEWTYGLPIPPAGTIAACMLACQIAGEVVASCGPSRNAESISREGVTIILNTKSKTGIRFVDDWLDGFACGGRLYAPRKPQLMRTNT